VTTTGKDDVVLHMTRSELQDLVKEAVEDGVAKAFRDVGIHAGDPEQVDEQRADFRFTRRLRKSTEGMTARAGATLLILTMGGLVGLFITGLKGWIVAK